MKRKTRRTRATPFSGASSNNMWSNYPYFFTRSASNRRASRRAA